MYPLHLNRHVQSVARECLDGHARILLLPPLEYLPFVDLMRRAYLILTDSGGIQEEAPSLRVPVLVMRDATERPEGVEAGVAQLVGTCTDSIVAAAENLLSNRRAYAQMRASANPYGEGHAAEKIVRALETSLS